MKTIVLTLVACFLLTPAAFGQSELPEIGKIADIQNKTKSYIVADGDARTAILRVAEKQKGVVVLVGKPDEAEFFVEYKTISRQPFGFGGMSETGELLAWFNRGASKVVVWRETKTAGGYKGDTASQLSKKFFKEFVKR